MQVFLYMCMFVCTYVRCVGVVRCLVVYEFGLGLAWNIGRFVCWVCVYLCKPCST